MQNTSPRKTRREIGHIAFVVPDIDATIKFLSSLGIQMSLTKSFNPKIRTLFRGKEVNWDCIISRGNLGAIGLELIQPTGEGTPYDQFLKMTGGGIHHISLKGLDIKEEIATMEKSGAKVFSNASIGQDIVATYLEVETIPGVVFELLKGEF